MDIFNKKCHNCKYCNEKHDTDKGIPTTKCLLTEKIVLEYHSYCDKFEEKTVA